VVRKDCNEGTVRSDANFFDREVANFFNRKRSAMMRLGFEDEGLDGLLALKRQVDFQLALGIRDEGAVCGGVFDQFVPLAGFPL
jgi:hypothetical protein